MKLNQLSLIKSERGLRGVINAAWFGAKSQLLTATSNFEGVNRTVSNLRQAGYTDRAADIAASKRYVELESRMKEAALRAASLSAFADSAGIILDISMAPELQRGMDEKQLQQASEASGVDVATLKEKQNAAAKRRYDQQVDAQLIAEAEFFAAGYDDEIEIKNETVLNALSRQRDYMLEWTSLDLGELTILKADIEAVQEIIDREGHLEDQTDGSIDNAALVEAARSAQPSMAKMNADHQNAIASKKRRIVRKATA